ncbi:hypothetical protein ACGFXB_39110 [Streptomyces canus]|uniref:hypothetical protein n=1 Tax=Streptomyces canus TaxID=58343 RepID=UPI00371FA72D
MKIARELHDVVAHQQAQQILADLAGTTSSTPLELRATVEVLRHAGGPEADPLNRLRAWTACRNWCRRASRSASSSRFH